MHTIWIKFLYQPLINVLILIVNTVAFGNLGVAVIIMTVLVKILLIPLTNRSIEGQIAMKAIEPEIAKLKNMGLSKEEQARKQFELYKQNKVNPFSGCLLILIQLPIIFALYYVFMEGLGDASGLLYSFVKMPEHLGVGFMGVADITKPSIIFALLAGASQFLQFHLSPAQKKGPPPEPGAKRSFQDDISRSMSTQMKYVLPVMIFLVGLKLSEEVAI